MTKSVQKGLKIYIKVIMELGSNEAIKRVVEAGLGISIVPVNVVKREVKLKLLKIIRFSGEKFTRKFYIVYHKDKYLSNIIMCFFKYCDIPSLKVSHLLRIGSRPGAPE